MTRQIGRCLRATAFLIYPMCRVIVYIDGFNLYHAVADLNDQSLKWLDLWALSASLLRANETLESVNYFSAFATWLHDPYARHRAYVDAQHVQGVDPIMGKFKEKPRSCRRCGAKWKAHEEKETDVHIAVRLVADALLDRFDRAIVISADSDLAPALKTVRQHRPRKEILVVAPPGRFASARDLGSKLELTKGRIRRCLLPAQLRTPAGKVITRPREYDP